MIYIVCEKCSSALRVTPGKSTDDEGEAVEAEDLVGPACEWYPDKYPCPKCGELGRLVEAVDPMVLPFLQITDVTPFEAFRALCGVGLPEEHDCGTTAVELLFTTKRVKSVETRPIRGSNRCILDSVEFEDGTRAHLASSSLGATVFRISKVGHG